MSPDSAALRRGAARRLGFGASASTGASLALPIAGGRIIGSSALVPSGSAARGGRPRPRLGGAGQAAATTQRAARFGVAFACVRSLDRSRGGHRLILTHFGILTLAGLTLRALLTRALFAITARAALAALAVLAISALALIILAALALRIVATLGAGLVLLLAILVLAPRTRIIGLILRIIALSLALRRAVDAVVLVVGIVAAKVAALILAGAAIFVLTGTVVGEHAEIMVGKLQIIFGGHAVAVHLRIVRHLLVFLEHLRGIAARPAVDPVALIHASAATIVLRTVIATAATTARSTIVVQS